MNSCISKNKAVRNAAQIIIGQCYMLETQGCHPDIVAEIKKQALNMDRVMKDCIKQNGDGMNDSDLMWLAINAYHEARGESKDGQIAVCHVVLNRCASRHQTVQQVIFAPMQFSWANGGQRPPIKDYDSLVSCYQAARECCTQRAGGQVMHGADHYFADYIAPPIWAHSMKEICKIGHHTFFKS